mgnify:CR=1 FL=1
MPKVHDFLFLGYYYIKIRIFWTMIFSIIIILMLNWM